MRRRSCCSVWSRPRLIILAWRRSLARSLGPPLEWPGCTLSPGSIQSCGSIVRRRGLLPPLGFERAQASRRRRCARKITCRRLGRREDGRVEGFQRNAEEYWMFTGGWVEKKNRWKGSGRRRQRLESISNENICVQSQALIFRFHKTWASCFQCKSIRQNTEPPPHPQLFLWMHFSLYEAAKCCGNMSTFLCSTGFFQSKL